MIDPSNELSHLKILALLLFELASVPWVKELNEFDSSAAERDTHFAGTEEEKVDVRKDIAAGRGTYLAWNFVVMVTNWFEGARTDRIQRFEYRGTLDFEHDMMVYLLAADREQTATYLILKALYARDPTPDASSN